MLDQEHLDAAHLLRRAGFGAPPERINEVAAAGFAEMTAKWLQPPPPQPVDPATDPVFIRLQSTLPDAKRDVVPVQFVKMWWIHRMLFTDNPLVEKMTLFWHGHFATKLGGQQGPDVLRQNQLFREHALGNFRTLTRAISKDPAMLRYLNGNQNFKAHPNENYARELMELFTCGIGNYTEDDVKAAARAFSGWNMRQDDFFFNPRQHDDEPKTFLGVTGNWNGDDVVDRLVAHPATARRLCTQLFSFFGYDDAEPEVIGALIKTYYNSGYDIGAVVGQILRSRAFYSAKARGALIKCPTQFVVGSIRMFGLETAYDLTRPSAGKLSDLMGAGAVKRTGAGKGVGQFLANADIESGLLAGLSNGLRQMGQDLLAPPSVKGWDGGEAWINSATMQSRVAFADRLARLPIIYKTHVPIVIARARSDNRTLSESWVDYLCEILGPLKLSPESRRTVVEYVSGTGTESLGSGLPMFDPQSSDISNAFSEPSGGPTIAAGGERLARRGGGRIFRRLQGAIPLIMATAEYQVC